MVGSGNQDSVNVLIHQQLTVIPVILDGVALEFYLHGLRHRDIGIADGSDAAALLLHKVGDVSRPTASPVFTKPDEPLSGCLHWLQELARADGKQRQTDGSGETSL